MEQYKVKAVADAERGLQEQTTTITASSYEEAKIIARQLYPEYKEIGVWKA